MRPAGLDGLRLLLLALAPQSLNATQDAKVISLVLSVSSWVRLLAELQSDGHSRFV